MPGRHALAGADIEALERRLIAIVSATLSVDRCELVRADGASDDCRLPADSPVARAMALRRTVVVDAASPAEGVDIPQQLVQHGGAAHRLDSIDSKLSMTPARARCR